MGSARVPIDQTIREALNLLKSVSPVQLVPRTACACFHQSRSLLGTPFPVSTWVLSGVGALGLVTFSCPFHRRQVSGCLRERGEVVRWSSPTSWSMSAQSLGSLREVGERRSADLWSSKGCKPEVGCLRERQAGTSVGGRTFVQGPASLRKCPHFSFSYSFLTRPTNTTSYTAWPCWGCPIAESPSG